MLTAAGLSLLWFVLGCAFYACAFACAGALVTIVCAAALVPLEARVYEGAVMRTGSAVKLRDAWRAARA